MALTCAERRGASAGSATPSERGYARAQGETAPDAARNVSIDPLWQAARSGDPVDLARLADAEGAIGLLDGLSEKPWADIALLALPLAADATLALAPLCARLERHASSQRAELLRAVHAIVAEPPRPVEHLAADSLEVCDRVLEGLLRKSALPASEHDLAESARRMLAEHTKLEAASAPTRLAQ